MKKMILPLIMIACMGIIYCSTGKQKEAITITRQQWLVVDPGENWFSKMKIFLFFTKTNTPQLAAWIEDDNGNYISTIAVTGKSAKGNWGFAPKEGRPEALPVWNHKQNNFSVTSDLDAVSSATIKGSLEANIDRSLLLDGNTYHVFLEINHSFDYNAHWTKDNSGVNGQPSLVYHAQFVAGHPANISLVPIGHGSVDGSNGIITRELGNFTSALNIVKNISVIVK